MKEIILTEEQLNLLVEKKLCKRGKEAAKKKFDVYPSAYANAYAVQVCKGKVKDSTGNRKTSSGWSKKKYNEAYVNNKGELQDFTFTSDIDTLKDVAFKFRELAKEADFKLLESFKEEDPFTYYRWVYTKVLSDGVVEYIITVSDELEYGMKYNVYFSIRNGRTRQNVKKWEMSSYNLDKIIKKSEEDYIEIKNFITNETRVMSESLDKWFKEKWVDVSKKDKNGKHPPCGRQDKDGDGKLDGAYPKCRKSKVAAKMTDKEKKNATSRKRKVEKKRPVINGKSRTPNFVK